MRHRRDSGLLHYKAEASGTAAGAPQMALPQLQTSRHDAYADMARAGLAAGAEIARAAGRAYFADQTARADEAALRARERFEWWRSDYEEKNQGRNAEDAKKDYLEAWDKISAEAEKEFDGWGNEVFGGHLRAKLEARRPEVIRQGASWQERQREAYLQSVLAGQMADFTAYAASNPDDAAGIGGRRKELLASWMARNPGLEPGAMQAELNAKELESRMEGFIASGDIEGARGLLDGYSRIESLRPKGTNKEWCLAYNNPGAVTTDDKHFAAYATRRDGLKAVMDRLKAYHDGRRKARTPAEFITIYAPPEENRTERYIADVGRISGLDMGKAADVNDPELLARLAKGILHVEFGFKAGDQELLEAARDFLRNGPPRVIGRFARKREDKEYVPGLNPAAISRYRERLAALENAGRAAADEAEANQIVEGLNKFPIERRTAEALKAIEGIEDAEKRARLRPLIKRGVDDRKSLDYLAASQELMDAFAAHMRRNPEASQAALEDACMRMAAGVANPRLREDFKAYASAEIQNRRQIKAAADAAAVEKFLSGQKGKSPGEIQAALKDSGLSPEAQARAYDLAWGLAKEESPDNKKALALALALKDAGRMQNDSEIESFAQANSLTLGQVQKIREYKGAASGLTIGRVNSILRQLEAMSGGPSVESEISAEGYYQLLKAVKPGREPTDQELMELLCDMFRKTREPGDWLNHGNVMERTADEELFRKNWLPEYFPHERADLEKALLERGVRPTESNLRLLLKLNLFERRGWPIYWAPQWED